MSMGLSYKLFHNVNFKIFINVLFSILVIDLAIIFGESKGLISSQYKNVIIYAAFCIAGVVILFIFAFFIYIIKSVSKITEYAKALASGKLSTDDIEIEGKNDFAILAGAINDMKSNIIFFIDNTKNNILILDDSTENISKSMNVTYSGNTQIANKIEGISSKSQEQLKFVENYVEKINYVNKSIASISERIDKMKTVSYDTNMSSNNGKEILNAYNENIKLVSRSVEDTEEFMLKLKSSAHEIEKVVDFIVELSEELKMLSLNASIEAIRAGEAGKGFAVVANEIIKLSNDTREGIDKINKIVSSMLGNSDDVEVSIKNSLQNIEKGNQIFTSITEVFSQINKRSENLLSNASDIVAETSNINSNTNSSVEIIEHVREMSEDISNNTEESVGVIQEELAEFQEINGSMTALQSLLSKIEKLTNKFELDIKPIDKNPERPLKIAVVLPNLSAVWDIIRFGILYGSKVLRSRKTSVDIIQMSSFSDEDFIKTIKAINECVKNKYDGIIMPGFFEEQVNNIVQANISIVTYNVDIKLKDKRITFVGQDSYKSGEAAAKTMIEQIGKNGKLIIITADKPYENMELRKSGFIDTIKKNKNNKIVDILEIPFDNEKAYEIVKKYLQKHTEISGIFNVTSGAVGIARAIKECKMQDSLKTIVYDTTQDILELIDGGIITCTIGEDPFRQGYDSLIYLYNYLVAGEIPDSKQSCTKIQIINKKNLKHFLV